jgi:hypothetical protein
MAVVVPVMALSAQVVAAQQPQQGRADSMMGMPAMAHQHLRAMDSMTARLDTLVNRMNQATGNKKMTAMADVINELVTQRKAMQSHMREMMQSRPGMRMPMMQAPAPAGPRPAAAKPDSGTPDSAAHEQHHPPQ